MACSRAALLLLCGLGSLLVCGTLPVGNAQVVETTARGENTRSQPCGGGISLSVVVDTTSSMKKQLRVVRKHANRMLNQLRRTPGHHVHDYVAVELNEQVTDRYVKTTNPKVFNNTLHSLEAFGGGDCQENMLLALLTAIEHSCPKSTIYVFSDSTPKDQYLLGTVLERLQAKEQHVVFILSGRCGSIKSPSQNAVKTIATTSGGQIFWVLGGNIGPVLNYMRMTYKAKPLVLLAWQLHTPTPGASGSGLSLSVAADSSVGSISAFVSCLDGQVSANLTMPEGATRGFDNRQWKKNLGNNAMMHVERPSIGQWTVSLQSSSECMVRVVGSSAVDLSTVFREPTPRAVGDVQEDQGNTPVLAEIEGGAPSQSTPPTRGDHAHMLIVTRNEPSSGLGLGRVELIGVNGSGLAEVDIGNLDDLRNQWARGPVTVPAENFYLVYIGQYQGATMIRYSTTAFWPRPPREAGALAVNPDLPVARTQVCGAMKATCSITGHDGEPVASVWMHGDTPLRPTNRISLVGESTRTLQINPVYKSDMGVYTCTPARPGGMLSSGYLQVVVEGSGSGPCLPTRRLTWHSKQCLFVHCTLPVASMQDNQIRWHHNTQQIYHDSRNVFTWPNGTLMYCATASEENVCSQLSGEFTCRGYMRATGEELVRAAAMPNTCEDDDDEQPTADGRPQSPCDSGQHTCHPMARCFSTLRGYVCKCNPGYTGDGQQCMEMSCPMPSNPTNGNVMISGGLTVGARITYMCHAGYDMVGDRQQSCNPGGTWSGIKPQCIAVVETQAPTRAPQMPSYLRIVPVSPLTELQDNGCMVLRCTVQGRTNPTATWWRNSQRLQLTSAHQQLADGSLRVCPFSAALHNGVYRCHASNDEGQMLQRTIIVAESTSVAPPEPSTASPAATPSATVSCPVLIPPLNGDVTLTNGYSTDSIAEYACDPPHELQGGDASRQCDASGMWTGRAPTCESVLEEPTTDAPAPQVINRLVRSRSSASCVKLTCEVNNPRFQRSMRWTHSRTFNTGQRVSLATASHVQTGGVYSVTLEDRSLQICNGVASHVGQYCCAVNLAGQQFQECVHLGEQDLETQTGSLGGTSECGVELRQCKSQHASCDAQLSAYQRFMETFPATAGK
ncbi:uncharacterized protein LOC135822608 [Sycon ciliatum]|uniref:uncharacterized protein LOC135822608 n=1 Tax=Sycon ciliatum TaxID=27933 RepID=UPI0031F70C4E